MNTIPDSTTLAQLGLASQPQATAHTTQLGQDDFLKLMTTQLKNQDPFKPMDNGEFMGQMAQFSTVTGIDKVGTELQNLAGSLVSNQTLQAAGMLGHEVLVPGPYGNLPAGGSVSGAVELDKSVTNMRVGIYDSSGQLVRNIDLGMQSPGKVAFNWDGLATDGTAAPPGRYEIRAEAVSGGVNEAYNVLLSDTVKSVSLPSSGNAFTLELANLGNVDFSAVREIR
jgi:flagellar basal-body rod modification protein FlgD